LQETYKKKSVTYWFLTAALIYETSSRRPEEGTKKEEKIEVFFLNTGYCPCPYAIL
jgi:hypothetical protein